MGVPGRAPGRLLGFTPTGFLEPTNLILMLAILFGLSTDYEVFLLSRVREEWDRTGDNTAAVATGLQRTGGIITAAALLLIVVVGGFATGGVATIKMLGVGTVVAVAVDAALVRTLLVPATMRLLGRWNWWAPGPLAPGLPPLRPARGRARPPASSRGAVSEGPTWSVATERLDVRVRGPHDAEATGSSTSTPAWEVAQLARRRRRGPWPIRTEAAGAVDRWAPRSTADGGSASGPSRCATAGSRCRDGPAGRCPPRATAARSRSAGTCTRTRGATATPPRRPGARSSTGFADGLYRGLRRGTPGQRAVAGGLPAARHDAARAAPTAGTAPSWRRSATAGGPE